MVSILLGSYNRAHLIKNIISSILKIKNVDFELIVTDDASSDNTKDVVLGFGDERIRFLEHEKNVGVFANFYDGICAAKGKYIWKVGDDDDVGDADFLALAVERLEGSDGCDLVFGKLIVTDGDKEERREYPFCESYDTKSFLSDWFGIITNISDSCFVFKKELLLNSYPINPLIKGNTLDYFITYNCVVNASKIAFIDRYAYRWRKSTEGSLSGSGWDDLLRQTKHIMAFPFEVIDKGATQDKSFFNRYIKNSFYQILSNYALSKNREIFEPFLQKYRDLLSKKSVYLYGKGELGEALKGFLTQEGVAFKGFLDDYRKDGDFVSFEDITDKKGSLIIIATYKCEYAFKMYKKCVKYDLEVLDLMEFVEI